MSFNTAKEWLDAWDRGDPVTSVSMSKDEDPEFEQTIQIITAELIRIILNSGYQYNAWVAQDGVDAWMRDHELIREQAMQNPVIQKLDMTNAQYSSALFLAAKYCVRGPAAVLAYPEVQDRKIQIRRA